MKEVGLDLVETLDTPFVFLVVLELPVSRWLHCIGHPPSFRPPKLGDPDFRLRRIDCPSSTTTAIQKVVRQGGESSCLKAHESGVNPNRPIALERRDLLILAVWDQKIDFRWGKN